MLRFFFVNAFIGIHTIGFSIWGILISIFDRTGSRVHRYTAVPWAKTILWVCGIRLRLMGLENAEDDAPCVYMANHQSYFDIFALLAGLPVDFKFILKKELMKIPILGFAMKRVRYIAIDRGDPRRALISMNKAAQKIRNGASVLIFPEGSRSKDGRVQSFKKGGFHLALKSGCDIVPVSIIGSRDIVPKGSMRVNRGTIDMHIGRPIPIGGWSRRDMDKLINLVRETVIRQMDVEPDPPVE